MTVLSIILGILLAAAGFSCLFTPLLTFLGASVFIAIIMIVYGISGIINAAHNKDYSVNFVFSIISLIFGICILFIPDNDQRFC